VLTNKRKTIKSGRNLLIFALKNSMKINDSYIKRFDCALHSKPNVFNLILTYCQTLLSVISLQTLLITKTATNKTGLKELAVFDKNYIDIKYKTNSDFAEKSEIGFDFIETGVRNISNGLNVCRDGLESIRKGLGVIGTTGANEDHILNPE